ncbi:putative C6 transcription factor [Aspergillus glaucus CBS 516.65]|uniref:Zn(2)-C6 fungal-type domain-containing protein n=1 Tax=Aspergillus glaucus CBS 516.65 TaxID=1160497 RepID=A0A1L9W0D5_ASPGL|nr:hypothetical protein ASPGLDRAFT_162185 [Aspergillus glaucus CBS 516.65]OJJ89626.1 hypothetical protein ASPGLDRAFT_162185 [Aspergillus glaucus CBS 516.65]
MSSDESACIISAPYPTGTKRIPKACSSCRLSKVKCDGKKPCTRCDKLKKRCVFFEAPKDPVTARLETVESEVQHLREQFDEMHQLLLRRDSQPTPTSLTIVDREQQSTSTFQDVSDPLLQAPGQPEIVHGTKRKRSEAEIQILNEPILDFVSKGLITVERAMSCFRTFFNGCDRYIPVFNPEYDTFVSVRSRSTILFNAICTIGYRVETKPQSQISDVLHAELKKSSNLIIQNKDLNCLESVQGILIAACYSAERSLLLSFATRMALDLNLDGAFEKLIQRLAMRETDACHDLEEERSLMRESRTWFGLLVLEHIFRVDGGKPPGIRFGGSARRCRVLLGRPSSTVLDLRLFAQVELNILRANINDTLGSRTLDRLDITSFVHETKIDLDLWFDDWLRIIENSPAATEEKPFLLAALRVQKCWAELTLHCKALQSMGVENVAAISPTEQSILLTAKAAAKKHLALITTEPDHYLAQLRYAMDFVWAKCAFCFLLLLKLSRLLPEREEEHRELLRQGETLLEELTKAGSGSTIYLQILKMSIEKYGRTLQDNGQMDTETGTEATGPFWELFDAQTDLQSFVPEQFVSEWEFPGLNLFYFPIAWQDFFGDFSLAI